MLLQFYEYPLVVTVEEHFVSGGLGTILSEVICSQPNQKINLLKLGLPNNFLKSGTYDQLLKRYNLDPEGISNNIQSKYKLL